MIYERINPSNLHPHPSNSRLHPEDQLSAIAASYREFGFNGVVVIDENNTILAGHGRVKAAIRAGLADVPCQRVVGWDDAKKRAYVIADNQVALAAEWDEELLKLEIQTLQTNGFDMADFGFADEFLAGLLDSGDQGSVQYRGDPDAVPEVPMQPITVTGDVWVMGGHRLRCGDSTNVDDVGSLMRGEMAELVFTDPPYGVSYQSNMRTKSERFDVLANDDQFLDIAPVIAAHSRGWVFVWTSWKVQTKWIDLMASFGYPTNIVVWHKPGGGIGDLKRTFSSDYEVALVWHRGAELCGKRIWSVWTVNKDGASTYVHPTQKPVALAEEAMDKTTRPNAIVLDMFGGSGSTMIAAEKAGRVSRLMELDPKYCDVIVKRWQDFTGREAIHEATGKTFNQRAAARDSAAA